MDKRDQRSATGTSVLARAALTLVIIFIPACSTATAAGCGAGIAAGVVLAGIAAASSEGSVNAGTAMVGGGLFGIASGCTAAGVAEGITRAEKHDGHARDYAPTEPHATATQAPPPMKRSDGVVTTQADLLGIKLVWIGSPPVSATKVALRFDRYGSRPVLGTCDELNLRIDDRSMMLPWRRNQANASTLMETAQVETDIDTARAIATAHGVEFNFCGVHRHLNLAAADATRDFVTRFSALGGAAPSPATHSQATDSQDAKVDAPPSPTPAPPVASLPEL